MAAPPFAKELLGWRPDSENANTSDSNSTYSKTISARILELLGIPKAVKVKVAEEKEEADTGGLKRSKGRSFENAVAGFLEEQLRRAAPERPWTIASKALISDFSQYQHLAKLQDLIRDDETGILGTEIGRDYLIKPDVTVAMAAGSGLPFLHASVSCKWTIRSDRVQNIRHEAVILTRHRRGRQPHIVAVTAEPLPTRLAAIARGTGEVDAVYHIVLEELVVAVAELADERKRARGQRETLDELREQGRLRDFPELVDVLRL